METETKRTQRPFNFGAGPAAIHEDVLQKLLEELTCFEDTGLSIIELSHRSPGGPVQRVVWDATCRVRSLLHVPDSHVILWQHGGGHGQFAAVALNLLGDKSSADYIDTGVWSQRAMTEAAKFCTVRVAASSAVSDFTHIPPVSAWDLSKNSAYVHICANDTICGLEFLEDPELGEHLLVADFTSTLFSRPVNVGRYAAIYCASGKNLGPAGVCLVIVRNDLLGRAKANTPLILDWTAAAASTPIPSLVNTPPVFAIYACGLTLQKFEEMADGEDGALVQIEARAAQRAKRIYDIIDSSNGFYLNNITMQHRSRMTICFYFGADVHQKRKWNGSITATVQLTDRAKVLLSSFSSGYA